MNTTATTIDFTSFLKLMAHQRASDLFITAGMPPAMKVNGKISPITQTPLTPQQSRDLVLNVMTPAQREEFEKTHECNFAIGLSGVGRFRVSCFYQRNQVGMVLRRIETRIPTVEELSLPPIIKTLAMTKRGIILFVGATTENPSFELNSALLSRCRVHVLEGVSPTDIVEALERALGDRERGLGEEHIEVAPELLLEIATAADGDVRRALTLLEIAAELAGGEGGRITPQTLTQVLADRTRRFDKGGEQFYDQISALG